MPLVKIFAQKAMTKPIPLAALQSKLCDVWGTKPNTTKLMLFRVEDWTDESFQEDCYGMFCESVHDCDGCCHRLTCRSRSVVSSGHSGQRYERCTKA